MPVLFLTLKYMCLVVFLGVSPLSRYPMVDASPHYGDVTKNKKIWALFRLKGFVDSIRTIRKGREWPEVTGMYSLTEYLFEDDDSLICKGIPKSPVVSLDIRSSYGCKLTAYNTLSMWPGDFTKSWKQFIQEYGQSYVGMKMIDTFKETGISRRRLIKYLKNTWFIKDREDKYSPKTTLFKRVFFTPFLTPPFTKDGYDWYGLVAAMKNEKIDNVKIEEQFLKDNHIHGIVVNYSSLHTFGVNLKHGNTYVMLGLHPYYTFTLLTLCIWTNKETCDAILPGTPAEKVQVKIRWSRDLYTFPQSGYIQYPNY